MWLLADCSVFFGFGVGVITRVIAGFVTYVLGLCGLACFVVAGVITRIVGYFL